MYPPIYLLTPNPMSELDVVLERLNTHIIDSGNKSDFLGRKLECHDSRLQSVENFMLELKVDVKWVQKIGLGILAISVSPYAVKIVEYLISKH